MGSQNHKQNTAQDQQVDLSSMCVNYMMQDLIAIFSVMLDFRFLWKVNILCQNAVAIFSGHYFSQLTPELTQIKLFAKTHPCWHRISSFTYKLSRS